MCARVAHIARAKLVAIAPGTLSTTQILPRVQTDIVPLDANLPEEEVAARVQWRAAHGQHVQTLVATLTSGQLHKALAFRRDELPPKLSMLVTESLGVSE